jgi:lipoprotein-anchoring transpeptidase ErfK/SrfK
LAAFSVSASAQRVCADTHGVALIPNNSFIFNAMNLAQGMHFFPAQAIGTKEDAMATLRHSGLAVMAMAAVLVASAAAQSPAAPSKTKTPAAAQTNEQSTVKTSTAKTGTAKTGSTKTSTTRTAPATPGKTKIVVSLEDHKLALIEDGQVTKIYTVAVGKPSTPSPVGTFTIARRVANPTYAHNGKVVPPGPHNPVGSRWMGLSIRGYGIHGTNEPHSIGKAASHGCIRMAKTDLEELYPQITVGDTVEIVGQRDEETAAIFGGAPLPLPAATEDATQLARANAADAPQAHPATGNANASAAPVNTLPSATLPAPVSGVAVSGVAITGAL